MSATAHNARSLTNRLSRRLAVVIVVAFGLFITVLLVDFSQEARELEEASLLGVVDTMVNDPGRFHLPEVGLMGPIRMPGITLRRPDGTPIYTPERWAIDVMPTFPLRFDEYSGEFGRDIETGEELLAVSATFEGAIIGLPGETVVVQIARPTSDFGPIIRSFYRATFDEMWWIFALILLITLLVVRLTIRGAVIAVERVSEQAAAIAPDEFDRRLSTEGLPREILPLVERMNAALDRLEAGYRAERSFSSSAAHELRTPLSVLRTRLETVPPGVERDGALEMVDRMARLVGQMLQIARIDTWRSDPGELQDVVAVCESVARDLAPEIVRRGGDIDLTVADGAPAWRTDRILAEIVVRNLIENAIRHGGERPRIRVMVGDHEIRVADDGPGIDPEQRARVFEMFWRRDRAATVGAGIGLALVRRIARRLGGDAWIEQAAAGGALVVVAFGPVEISD